MQTFKILLISRSRQITFKSTRQCVLNDSLHYSKNDPIPIVPGRGLGYSHPSHEKHIVAPGFVNGSWYSCEGQDNTNTHCSTGAVTNLLEGDLNDHDGPYGGIKMGCLATSPIRVNRPMDLKW